MRKKKNYWTKEKCKEAALSCKTKTEFRKNFISAYNNSWENGWIDEFSTHMEILGNSRKRLVYSYEFSDNYVYVGITCNENRRNKQHNEIGGPVYQHKQKTNLSPIKKIMSEGYIDVLNAKKMENEVLNDYLLRGWSPLNKNKTGGLGGNILFWNKDECRNVAIKCKSRKEFSNLYGSGYISARKNKWLDEICSHMERKRKPNNYWNYENCKNSAINCLTRYEYSRKFSSAYFIGNKNNWLNDFFPIKQNIL